LFREPYRRDHLIDDHYPVHIAPSFRNLSLLRSTHLPRRPGIPRTPFYVGNDSFPMSVKMQNRQNEPKLSSANPCKTIVKPRLVFLTFSGCALSYLSNLMGFTGRGEHKITATCPLTLHVYAELLLIGLTRPPPY
jgi:hypothetical protein